MSGGMCEVVRAETADLDRFVEQGARYAASLRAVFDGVASARDRVTSQMGAVAVPPALVARPLGGSDPLAELIAEATLANAFTEEIGAALSTSSTEGAGRLAPAEEIDAALALVGLDVVGPDRFLAADQETVEALAVRRDLLGVLATGSGLPDHLQGHQIGLSLEEYLAGLDGQQMATAAAVLVDLGLDLQAGHDPDHADAPGLRTVATMFVTQGLLSWPGDQGVLLDGLAESWVSTGDGGRVLGLSLLVDALDLEQANDDLSIYGLSAGPWQRANQPFVRQAVLSELIAASRSADGTISPAGQRLVDDVLDRYPAVVELSAGTWHEIELDDRHQNAADGRACRVWPTSALRAVLASALAAPNYGVDSSAYTTALALDDLDQRLADATATEVEALWREREILLERLGGDPESVLLLVEAMGRGLSAPEALRLLTYGSEPGLTDARVRRLRLVYDTNPWGDPVPVDQIDPSLLPPGVARSLAAELGVLQSIQLARFAQGRPTPEIPLTDGQIELVARYDEVAAWFHHGFAWGWPGGAEGAVDHLRNLDDDELERIFGNVPDGFGDLLDELGQPSNQIVWDLMAGASGHDTYLGPDGTYRPAGGRTVVSADPGALLVQLALLRELGPYQELLDQNGSGTIHEDEVERWLEAASNDPSIPPALVDRVTVGAGAGVGEDTFGWDELAGIIGVVGLAAAVAVTIVYSGGTAVPLWVQGGLVGLAALEGYAAYQAGDNIGAVLAGAGGVADLLTAARLLRLADNTPIGPPNVTAGAIERHPDLIELARRSDLTALNHLADEAGDLTSGQFIERYQAILDQSHADIVDDLIDERLNPAGVAIALREADIQPVLALGRIDHALDGNINGADLASGGHYTRSDNIRILTRSQPDHNGVTTGTISVRDPDTGKWVSKRPQQLHTFFPEHWTRRQTELEIDHAFNNSRPVRGSEARWRGTASDGTPVVGWYTDPLDPRRGWSAAYPLYGKVRSIK